jgi:hypothetical protein
MFFTLALLVLCDATAKWLTPAMLDKEQEDRRQELYKRDANIRYQNELQAMHARAADARVEAASKRNECFKVFGVCLFHQIKNGQEF